MFYELKKLPLGELLKPVSEAAAQIARLDERIARSEIGIGWNERSHYRDACASLWVEGELVHLEELVLHDAGHDIRAPTRELTIARDVLRSRRRIVSHGDKWAFTPEGIGALRQGSDQSLEKRDRPSFSLPGSSPVLETKSQSPIRQSDQESSAVQAFNAELASIDALLARSTAALEGNVSYDTPAKERDPLIYDADWDEDHRLQQWMAVLDTLSDLPPVLRVVLALDAWNELQVLQHASWLGRLLAGAILRDAGLTTQAHLISLNLGLRAVPVEKRRHPNRKIRLLAYAQALVMAAEQGLKEHDRLLLAHRLMERKVVGRRASSSLPQLMELAIARPVLSAGMIADALKVTPRAALRLVEELGLRELTGRGRFRAWGIL